MAKAHKTAKELGFNVSETNDRAKGQMFIAFAPGRRGAVARDRTMAGLTAKLNDPKALAKRDAGLAALKAKEAAGSTAKPAKIKQAGNKQARRPAAEEEETLEDL